MKFTNGYWLNRSDYQLQHPQSYHSHRQTATKLTVYAPYEKISQRGNTLNTGMTTMELSSPLADVIKVRLTHHDIDQPGPHFELTDSSPAIEISETEETVIFQSGEIQGQISKSGKFNLAFYGNDRLLTESKYGAQAEIQERDPRYFQPGINELYQTQGPHYMREQLSLGVDELLYGLGERFTPLIKNGQSVDSWNEDPGTGSEQAYKNIPFYLSNKGYGILVNHPEKVSFELASENVSRAQFSVEGEVLEYLVIYGPSTKEILMKYTALTGKPALPPAWSFGLWLSTSFTTDYSEATVMSFIDEMQRRELPFEVFHFDTFWMKEFEWCNFEWDDQQFPDPQGMLQRIHDKGVKICLWINPYIGQKSPLFNECRQKGYFLKRADGQVWQWDLWQGGMGIIDFTNPAAKEWYQDHLRRLLAMGVDSFKTDFGERIPDNAVYFDQSDPKKAHNYYSYLYNEAVFEVLEANKGKNEAIVFARSASVGSQKFPVHWGGDNLSVYSSMAESLRGGLSFLLSGFGFWSHDIGGFEENATADIYKRWTQFGLLSTHSRYHGNIEYRVPWNYGEEAVAVTRQFSQLKNKLMPYLYREAVATSKTGVPMMRPIFMEFEEDPTTFYLDKQYFLGSALLVAPIFNETGSVTYYLPKGKWTHLLTSEIKELAQGQWLTETYDYFSLPVFVKENSLIVTGKNEQQAVYDYLDEVTISCYQLTEGEHHSDLVNQKGELCGKVKVVRVGETYRLLAEGITGQATVVVYHHDKIERNRLAADTELSLSIQ
ncbi:alpha-xylosidase [Vagococcus sp. BWB3-3]|uniref:alpha-D-xyloside xylohydrolase n=1 Tax=Vagococcus allomyrinae TaxID=2794353 RepID=A0A940PC64_9ENTE|nr:alpha-xylosidase [Vagococcus allomyrinae]MBP1042279.1 alpha-xylosidase [Vagococcus allomyrinae]